MREEFRFLMFEHAKEVDILIRLVSKYYEVDTYVSYKIT